MSSYSDYPINSRRWILMRLLIPPMILIIGDIFGFLLMPDLLMEYYAGRDFWSVYLSDFAGAVPGFILLSEANLHSYILLDRVLPWEEHPALRLLAQIGIGLVIAFCIVSVFFWVMMDAINEKVLRMAMFGTVVQALALTGIFIGIFFFHRLKTSMLETERLKQAHLEAQNEALRQQIDPHFLFNSLNTLTSIIEEDRTLATEFVQRLARVYRYVLQAKEDDLASLQAEIDFVRDYAFALNQRFGDNFHLVINIPPRWLASRIPPLTLQILVENAVKHNVISRDQPLTVSISVDDRPQLVVWNNLQKKNVASSGTHVGLNNIIARYSLLSDGIVDIDERDGEFTVRLPLINGESSS